MLNRACPSNHIDDWMPERKQVELIDEFEATLPSDVRVALAEAADARRTCAIAQGDEVNSCEKITDIHALRRLHLLGRFSAYACTHAICTELVMCDRPPARR
jgi:hypothetical protein